MPLTADPTPVDADPPYYDRPWTIGVVGHGVGTPSPIRTRPDLCPQYDHPPVTYNPGMDQTWCLCGAQQYPGDVVTRPHMACCGGPLVETITT